MENVIDQMHLIGIKLPAKTTNENGQSGIDIGSLWQRFEKEAIFSKIPGKTGNEVIAVYHEYEGDHMQPFSYFIGCKVKAATEVPEGLESISIPKAAYHKFVAKGKMPDCIGIQWQEIWESPIKRAYKMDFEVYDERSYDWSNAEVDIFVSVEEGD